MNSKNASARYVGMKNFSRHSAILWHVSKKVFYFEFSWNSEL